MHRLFLFLAAIALCLGFFLPTADVRAQTHTFSVPGAAATACGIYSNPESFGFNVTYNWPDGPLVLEATVIDADTTGLSGTSSVTLPAGSGTDVPAAPFSFATSASLPVPYPWAFTLRVIGYLNGVPTWTADVRISCPAAAGPYTVTELSNGPYVVEEVVEEVVSPGCDVLLPIPSTAVGGAFVADAPVYWKPGELTNPLVTIKAGNTARVIGQDASGQYYKIIWACDFVWVPKATMGPNYDAVWNGAPLPTTVVE